MSFILKQKTFPSQLDQPKYSTRTRFHQTSHSKITNQQKPKSVRKSSSIKYLKEISPKKSQSNSKFISNKILKLLDHYQQSLNNLDSQNFQHTQSYPSNCSKITSALKTIDFDQQRNYQTTRPNYDQQNRQHKISIKQNMLQKFQSNEAKIVLMRQNLEKIFITFKEREKQITQMKSSLKNKDKIKTQNDFLSKQISRVQQMIKQALLERQKLKYGPFSQLTKRNKK